MVLPDRHDEIGDDAFGFYEQVVELAARLDLANGRLRSASFLRLDGDLLTSVAAHDEPGSALHASYRLADHPELERAVDSGETIAGSTFAVAPVRTHGIVGVLAVDAREGEFGSAARAQLEGLARLIGFRMARDAAFTGLQREAELSQRLEQLKGEFLNIAAHELRSPLGVIRGYASMLGEGTLTGSLFDAALARIEEKSEEMSRLITEMLDTARLEAMTFDLVRERVALMTIVEDALVATRPLLTKDHRCTVVPCRDAIFMVVDRARVTTVLTNLIDNAIKYSPQGGDIEIRVDHDSRVATIVVQDHGMGIGAAQIPMLFSRFGRLVTSETSHIRGTGLGLYLAREIARLHRGDIAVESEAGAGSIFTLTLPLS
ncbi:MAG: HAMP domain-containing sensor histidine kinase [Candidatus Dormiibacterota bacterium]